MTDAVFSLSNISLHIKYALSVEHDHNWHETKSKTEYALWIITDGSLTIDYASGHYDLYKGDVFFFYPQVLYHSTSTGGCRFLFVHFDAVLGNNCQALHFYHFDGHYPAGKAGSSLSSLISGVASTYKKEPFSEWEIHGSLMLYLSNIMKIKYQGDGGDTISTHNSTMARLQPALIYINHHLSDPISIRELAASISLSEKYFITFFKKAMGVTPIQFVTQVKMKKALEYLHEQHYSAKEVAAMVGYQDIYTFSKVFKKVYGVAPTKF